MRKISMVLVGALFMVVHATAQENLKKVEGTGIYTSDNVFVDEKGEYFAKVFYITFNQHVTGDINQAKDIQSISIRPNLRALKVAFEKLEAIHGLQKMERVYPEAVPNDTIRYSKKGKRVVVSDFSKRYKLVFDELQSFVDIKYYLNTKEINKVSPPRIIFSTSDYPNDPYYDLQWAHKLLESEKVFNITYGDEDIIIGISDLWTSSSTHGVHEELEGRILAAQNDRKYVPGGGGNYSHGPRIAIIAAGANDNGKGVASLGGNMQVIPAQQSSGLPYFINLSSSLRPHVVNMSWTWYHDPDIKDDVESLLQLGVVLVGASVNTLNRTDDNDNPIRWPGQSTWGEPFIPYPASYNFPDLSYQVIATTATQLTDTDGSLDPLELTNPFQYEERFRFENYGEPDEKFYNYGLSNDPIANPSAAFTDVAAPSAYMVRAKGETATNDYGKTWGATSEAAPLVTSLVGMMLSVNPNLEVDEIYDIITSTTDYNNIVVPPGTVTNTLPDGRKYNKYIGFGRVNAYRAVKESLPNQYDYHTFNSNTTLGSSHINNATITSGVTLTVPDDKVVVLEGNINGNYTNVFVEVSGRVVINEGATVSRVHFIVEDGGELIIQPGSELSMSSGAWHNIKVNPGGKITAHGTEDAPIYFKRYSSGTAWGQIGLRSSEGNSFKWCVFDGGNKTVEIQSNNNTFEHCTFKNGVRGISSYYNQDGSGNGDATFKYCLVEDNSTVGVVTHFANFDISYTTIRDNTQAGLYIISSTVEPFHHNIVTGNGGTTRDGIEVKSSGTLWMHKQTSEDGYNEVYNNGEDQISTSGDLLVGTYPYPGTQNAIYGDCTGSRYLIENTSGVYIDAYNTYWNCTSGSSMFSGYVDDGNHLGSNPTSSVPHGYDGQAPSKVQGDSKTKEEVYDEAEDLLSQAETTQQVRDGLYRLYQLAGLSKSPELKNRFNQMALTAGNGSLSLYATSERNTTLRNYAKVLYTKSLIRDEQYEEADGFLIQLDTDGLTGYDMRDYLHLKMVTETYHDRYQQAWQTLQEYYSFRQAQGEDIEEVKADYAPFEEDLLVRLEDGDKDKDGQRVAEELASGSELFVQAYPNPFNPVTTINYNLPVKAEVRLVVYDMLGREVAKLVNGQQQAGAHTVTFDASQLSSGIYLYRMQAGSQVVTGRMTLIK